MAKLANVSIKEVFDQGHFCSFVAGDQIEMEKSKKEFSESGLGL